MRKTTAIVLLVVVAWALPTVNCLGQGSFDYPTTQYLKNYPEYKRGYDPYANLSGLLQENVDVYSGKLNLVFPLPTIPWSATKSFGPVLIYNSNVWMNQSGDSLIIEGAGAGSPAPEAINPWPAYWTNDAFVRFSPIGRPHAMPGWVLTIGGVYTEFVKDASVVEPDDHASGCTLAGEDNLPVTDLYATVKKKYFVAPDGSTHLLVAPDLNNENFCRPYITLVPIEYDTNPIYAREACSIPCIGGFDKCLPYSGMNNPHAWRAVDGSGYYYVEQQNADTLGCVYGHDGTCFKLDGTGMITEIVDTDQNTIKISIDDIGNPLHTKIVTYRNGNAMDINGVDHSGEIKIYYENKILAHGSNDSINCWLLKKIVGPTVGQTAGFEVTFNYDDLVKNVNGNQAEGTIYWSDVFAMDDYYPISGDTVFTTTAVAPNGSYSRQIFVLNQITLPDNRSYHFKYNRSGKIKTIIYPDGGQRNYQYGDTPCRSHRIIERYRRAAHPGESALGGVSLVWQGNPESGGAIERAYAYSKPPEYVTTVKIEDPTEADYLKTVVWKSDHSAEIHTFYPGAPSKSNIAKFGFPAWLTGKTRRMRRYDYCPTDSADSGFIGRFLTPNDNLYQFLAAYYQDLLNYLNGGNGDLPHSDQANRPDLAYDQWLQQEVYDYQNADTGWLWTIPDGFCTNNCSSSVSPLLLYVDYLPDPSEPAYFPENNAVMIAKRLYVREANGAAITRLCQYQWAAQGNEPNAVMTQETESDWAQVTNWGGTMPVGLTVRKKTQTYNYWWYTDPFNLPTNMPARVLGLPLTETTVDPTTDAKVAETRYHYPTNASPLRFHPDYTESWIEGSRYAKTGYQYTTTLPLRLQRTNVYENGNIVSSSFYDYETAIGPKLLNKTSIYSGNGTPPASPVQFLLLNYDPYTGLLLKHTNKNGGVDFNDGKHVSLVYDGFNRLSAVSLKEVSGGVATKTTTVSEMLYSEASVPRFTVTRKDYVAAGRWKEAITENDELGRPAKSATTVGQDANGFPRWSVSQKEYDLLGRVRREYGPVAKTSASWSGSTGPWREYEYDGLGRIVRELYYAPTGGSAVSSKLISYGSEVGETGGLTTETAQDEMGRIRKLYKDGAGRIVRVDEQKPAGSGFWRTDYDYTPLDDVKRVNKRQQNGADGQIRLFTYDGLGRLTSSTLPEYENHTFNYINDDRGNVTNKQFYSPIGNYQENVTYDGMNRMMTRVVNFKSQVVTTTCTYDGPGNGAGNLYTDQVDYPDGTRVKRTLCYEWYGALHAKTEALKVQNQSEASFSTVYDHNDMAQLWKATYPSGAVVENSYANGGGLSAVSVNNSPVFAGITNAASGAPETMTYTHDGVNVNGWREYDPTRFWLKTVKVGLGVGAATPMTSTNMLFGLTYTQELNGNILTMNRLLHSSVSSTAYKWMNGSYEYDNLNRLKRFSFQDPEVTNNNWDVYQYNMDEYGNLLAEEKTSGTGGGPASISMNVNSLTNRIGDGQYDSLGNQCDHRGSDGAPLTLSYWDQGHMAAIYDPARGHDIYRYYYDGEGKRRIKIRIGDQGAVTGTSFAFYEGEDLVCEQDADDQIQDVSAYKQKFLLTDHLGTTRAELSIANGQPQITQTYDTMPYGRMIAPASGQKEQVVFTGKQRDPESGMDYFNARNYCSNLGRWPSPDQPFNDYHIDDPQSWNLYSYVGNSPICRIDQTGTAWYQETVEYKDREKYVEDGQVKIREVIKTKQVWVWRDSPTSEVWTGKRDSQGNKIFTKQVGLSNEGLYNYLLSEYTSKNKLAVGVSVTFVLTGQPWISVSGKLGGGAAVQGTSPISLLLSKTNIKSPCSLPMIVGRPAFLGGRGMHIRWTTNAGRFLGRAVPVLGWALLAYDVFSIVSEANNKYDEITSGGPHFDGGGASKHF